jgi:hypothetical protein
LSTGFFGIIVSLAGVISLFLVGMVFADLWASARLTKSVAKSKTVSDTEAGETSSVYDPFEDELETDKQEK